MDQRTPPSFPDLDVHHGPLDGGTVRMNARGRMVHVSGQAVHEYVLANDDTGARFWRYEGCVPLAEVGFGPA